MVAPIGSNYSAKLAGRVSNMCVGPPHSVVTALAQSRKRRAAGRAGYAHRYADMKPLVKSILSVACLWPFLLASCASTRVVSTPPDTHSSAPAVDPSQIVFVVGAAHSSQALAGVRVSLLGRDGIELELGTTDESGRLRVPKSLLQSHDVRVILFSRQGFFTGAIRIDSEGDYYSAHERYIELAPFAVT